MHTAAIDPRLTRLAFPLNVFACATVLQEGQLSYLHYGLFDSPRESILTAQQRSTELLLRRLPRQSDLRVLEIGAGVGVTARTIADLGYRVTGISPDPVQVSIARERAGPSVSMQVSTFEDFEMAPRAFDVILAQESSQYIALASFFSKAHELLVRGASLLVLDQVAYRRAHAEEGALHLDADIKEHARQFGFVLTEYVDLTRQAIPTLDYILGIIADHKQSLQTLMCMDASTLDSLTSAVAANRRRYHEGLLGYALYHFRVF